MLLYFDCFSRYLSFEQVSGKNVWGMVIMGWKVLESCTGRKSLKAHLDLDWIREDYYAAFFFSHFGWTRHIKCKVEMRRNLKKGLRTTTSTVISFSQKIALWLNFTKQCWILRWSLSRDCKRNNGKCFWVCWFCHVVCLTVYNDHCA